MASTLSPARVPDVQQLKVWRADASLADSKGGEKKTSQVEPAASSPAASHVSTPAKMTVEFDADSGRFVHTMLDPQTQEVLAMYPTQGQLAFSRAIGAYLKARRGE